MPPPCNPNRDPRLDIGLQAVVGEDRLALSRADGVGSLEALELRVESGAVPLSLGLRGLFPGALLPRAPVC